MFEALVVTRSDKARVKGRTMYFSVTMFALTAGLFVALVASLFAEELTLGTDNFQLVELIAPVEPPREAPPPPEPERPEPAPARAPTETAPKLATRQVVMARVDESPREVPTEVSTAKNTVKERPKSGFYEVGKFDSDPVGGATSGRSTEGSTGGAGTGLTPAPTTVAKVVEAEDPPPPPPVKKDPPPAPKKPVIQSMGVINGKAQSLPKPIYTSAAKAVKAQGQVAVKVLIDESGRVVSADAVSGHPLLKGSAESAALKARFSPTLLSGEAIKISGTIIYNFTG